LSSQLRKFRSAPAVNDLNDLKPIIKSLEYYPIPYSYLDTSNLKKLLKSGKLTTRVSTHIVDWKNANGIKLGAGYLSEIMNLLRVLEIVIDKKPSSEHLDNFLEPNGPAIKDIITEKINVQGLTDHGYVLCDLINSDNSKEYDVYLFWLFLKNNRLTPIWQYLLLRNAAFQSTDFREIIESIENDTFTVSAFARWSDYFNLCKIDSEDTRKILDEKKMALKFLHSTIFELNNSYVNNDGHNVDELVQVLTDTFHISSNTINFYNILEVIFKIDNKDSIEGSFTGRREKSLPSFPKINKLKIRKKIELFPKFDKIKETDLVSFINVGR
jgi:hypothetical protein